MRSAEPEPARVARLHRRARCAALASWDGVSWPGADGRHRLDVATLVEGEGRGAGLAIEARGQPWRLDLAEMAERMAACERGALVFLDRATGRHFARRLGCGLRVCPVCARARAARSTRRWRSVLEAAVADGARLRSLTLTGPVEAVPGGLVTERERRRGWVGTPPRDGELGRPVAGLGLLASYVRQRERLRRIRSNRGTRDLWRAGLGGYLVGSEWTGRTKWKPWVPRYHAHFHILTCHPPDEIVPTAASLARSWARHVGGSERAQRIKDVDPTAVYEVLKYPFKPGDLTSAMVVESLAVARGLHTHHLGGGWHPRPGGIPEPYRTWLTARPPEPDCARLYVQLASGRWEPYCGQVRRGLARWSYDPEGEAPPFTADARPFYDLLPSRTPGEDDDSDADDLGDVEVSGELDIAPE